MLVGLERSAWPRALVVTRVLTTLLFGVEPTDCVDVYLAVSMVLVRGRRRRLASFPRPRAPRRWNPWLLFVFLDRTKDDRIRTFAP
jgi:hypothetical protein